MSCLTWDQLSLSFCLDQNEFRIFFLSYKIMELSLTVLVALSPVQSVYDCVLDFLFLFLQNQMLDYSKRSRSGKFRLVTKFKKDKNNKNKETHSSMGLPGTKSAHSLSFCHISVVTPLPVLGLFPHTSSPSVSSVSASSCRSSQSFSCGRIAYCSLLSHGPPYHANIPEEEQEVPSEEFSLYRFSGIFQRVLKELNLRILAC